MNRRVANSYWLTLPAMTFYAALLLVPMVSTLLLSIDAPAHPSLGHFAEILFDPYFAAIFLRTFVLASLVTIISVSIGTMEALILFRMTPLFRGVFLVVVLAPLLVSVIVRTLGWAILLGRTGPISSALQWLHIVQTPYTLMYSMAGMTIALVHVMVPFVVISVWVSLQSLSPDIERAGASLGASRNTVFRRLILPQIAPGILSGLVVVFALSATAFATPAIVGGRRLKVVATTVYDEFLGTLNWPLGAAIAISLLICNVGVLLAYNYAVGIARKVRMDKPGATTGDQVQ
jgi:putative spermidine/putrescine transport system permease protein